jgi:endonuclease YncB( thermonuclease family)
MVFLALVLTGQANADVTGRARVIDGDTLEITAQRIRLALRRGKWN